MKQLFILFTLITLASCGGTTETVAPVDTVIIKVDSAKTDSVKVDSVKVDTAHIAK